MPVTMQKSLEDLTKMLINHFFKENTGVTQAECDEWAAKAVGGPVRASPFQFSYVSYNVEAVDGAAKVLQFRAPMSSLDVGIAKAAEAAYGHRFVLCHHDAGTFRGLHAYTMNDLGGECLYLARDQLRADDGRLLRNTLEDFAQFVAAPWHNSPSPYQADLNRLRQGLPERFHEMLDRLLQALPTLFDDDWPMTGRITGIYDWNDATVSPFGTSSKGIETLLGEQTMTGFLWVSNSAELHRWFWRAFAAAIGSDELLERVEVARLVGIFFDFGREWVDKENWQPVEEGSVALRRLEAVTLRPDMNMAPN
ncbi:hypothetical protein ACQKWADRAFT_320418 [Trichoderma austrokoningii]